MAAKAADWMIQQLCDAKDKNKEANTPDTCVLLGLQRRQYRFTPVQLLKNVTDFKWVPSDAFTSILLSLSLYVYRLIFRFFCFFRFLSV